MCPATFGLPSLSLVFPNRRGVLRGTPRREKVGPGRRDCFIWSEWKSPQHPTPVFEYRPLRVQTPTVHP